VVVEKVKMASGQSLDFCQRVIDSLRIELLSALEESDLVAKVAVTG